MNLREESPPETAYTHRFAVPEADIDFMGHANNVSWVRWINEAAGAHSLSVGLNVETYRRLGVLWVVRRHDVMYLGAAYAGEELQAVTWVASMRGAASVRKTLIRRATDATLLARAETTWALITAATGKPTRIPAELMARYGFAPPTAPSPA